MVIEWRGDIFDCGTKCGLGAQLTHKGNVHQYAVVIGPVDSVTVESVAEAVAIVERRIMEMAGLRAEVTEKGCEVSPNAGVS